MSGTQEIIANLQKAAKLMRRIQALGDPETPASGFQVPENVRDILARLRRASVVPQPRVRGFGPTAVAGDLFGYVNDMQTVANHTNAVLIWLTQPPWPGAKRNPKGIDLEHVAEMEARGRRALRRLEQWHAWRERHDWASCAVYACNGQDPEPDWVL